MDATLAIAFGGILIVAAAVNRLVPGRDRGGPVDGSPQRRIMPPAKVEALMRRLGRTHRRALEILADHDRNP